MKLHKRIASLLAASLIAVTFLCTPVLAANGERYSVSNVSSHNQAVEARKQQVEELYGIYVSYPTYEKDGQQAAAIYTETLDTLDTALGYVTPHMMRLISSHYYNKNGKRLRISYRFSDLGVDSVLGGNVEMGGFDPDESLIVLYIPRPGQGAAATGDIPMTIVHEVGHAVHMMIADSYGYAALESAWSAYNGGYAYNRSGGATNPSQTAFISGYAYTDMAEDFAETFAHVFVCNRSGMGFSNRLTANGSNTGLGNKVVLLGNLLKTYFPDCTDAHANYNKIYTTANAATYNGMRVTGPHLQFMGYAEPRYMPLYHLQQLGVAESSYQWVSAIGAWVGPKSGGGYVLLFPDANWAETDVAIL